MATEVDEIDAPAYWASYLVNGDASGLDDNEHGKADAWSGKLDGWFVVSVKEDSEYIGRWYGLQTDMCTYIVYRTQRPERKLGLENWDGKKKA
jgi:hypothetical protein